MIVRGGRHGFVVADPDDFTRFHVENDGLTAQEFAALLESSRDVEPHRDHD